METGSGNEGGQEGPRSSVGVGAEGLGKNDRFRGGLKGRKVDSHTPACLK